MKIALAQMEVVPGKPKDNVDRMLSFIQKAKKAKVDLIAFPEMCIGGYLLGDKWLEDSYCKELMNYNNTIKDASDSIAIIFGNIYLDENIKDITGSKAHHPNKDGRTRKYNAIYAFKDKKPIKGKKTDILPDGVIPKTLLPNYRFFDDERYFFSMQDIAKDFGVELDELIQPLEINKKQIGIELCEDLWCNDYRKDKESLNPTKILVNNGAELIINISASPWTFGKNAARDRRVQFIQKELGDKNAPFLYVNCTGCQNNGKNFITFDGGSTAYNKEGKPIIFAKNPYEEELMIIEDFNPPSKERKERPKIAQKYEAIIAGIKHIKKVTDFDSKFIVGMSGGVDSSLVAALLVKALGKEKVIGINMPSQLNCKGTKDSAEHTAKSLDIEYKVIPISDIIDSTLKTLDKADLKFSPFQKGNVHAKIRGTQVLSNVAASLNAVFTNNGNKIEVATGYATLYGDVGGAIAPIADLTKVEVFEMCRYLNNEVYNKEVIPKSILPDDNFEFEIPPTAELETNQKDPFKWGYHDAILEALTNYQKKTLEDFYRWYLQGILHEKLGISKKLLKKYRLDDPNTFIGDIEWFVKLIQKNIYKRIQAPPIIVLSKSAYGYDIRESQLPFLETKEQKKLKEKIMKIKKYPQSPS